MGLHRETLIETGLNHSVIKVEVNDVYDFCK